MLNRALFSGHLDDGEEVTRIVHKHWLLGFKALLAPTLVLLGLLAVLAMYYDRRPTLIVLGLGALATAVWWIRNFFDYYLDAWIITTHGVIDVEWHGFFHRESTRVLYSDIQGVSYEIKGVLPTLLRYGTISVEKISTGSAMSLDYVYQPKRVEGMVLRNMEGYLHSKNLKDAKQVQELLATLVAERLQLQELSPDDDSD